MPTTKLQNLTDFKGQKFYIEIDVHKSSWSVTIRSLSLHLEHFTQPPSSKTLLNHLRKKYPSGDYYSAYEAGFCGTGIHDELCKLGVYNIIVNAADIPTTDKQNKNKTDVRDSRSIAFLSLIPLKPTGIRGWYILYWYLKIFTYFNIGIDIQKFS